MKEAAGTEKVCSRRQHCRRLDQERNRRAHAQNGNTAAAGSDGSGAYFLKYINDRCDYFGVLPRNNKTSDVLSFKIVYILKYVRIDLNIHIYKYIYTYRYIFFVYLHSDSVILSDSVRR